MSRPAFRLLPADPHRLRDELSRLGVDAEQQAALVSDGAALMLRVSDLAAPLASLLVREAKAEGALCALAVGQGRSGEETCEVLLVGTPRAFRTMAGSLRGRASSALSDLALALSDAVDGLLAPAHRACIIGQREFVWGRRTYVMGIVNVTPDSFSGDGLLHEAPSGAPGASQAMDRALAQAERFLEQGADMLDVGGESTRPGASPLDAEAEMARVLPVIRALRPRTDVPISIDTYKADVARAALDAGADLVNDVWALQMDPDMAPLVAARQVPVTLMHNRSRPKSAQQQERLGGRYVGIAYENLMGDILRELGQQIDRALAAGIAADKIIVDPGVGFGKTVEQNLQLLNRLDELRVLGYPILLGPSRKSFIGYTLDLPPDQRVEGTAAAVVVGMLRRGADIVRVHDVEAIVRVVRMADAILEA
jgi:dihydropteroate synthase